METAVFYCHGYHKSIWMVFLLDCNFWSLHHSPDIYQTNTFRVSIETWQSLVCVRVSFKNLLLLILVVFTEQYSCWVIYYICLSYLITFVESGDPYVWRGYLYAISLFVLTIIRGIIQQQQFFGKFVTGMRIKSAVNAAVYRKVRANVQV